MSDKIKILQIKKAISPELSAQNLEIDNFWFEDNLDQSLSIDFDKVISLSNKKNYSKIDIVQNANSHFFRPRSIDLDINKEDLSSAFSSIELIEKNDNNQNPLIRNEIIEMRKKSYEKEQNDKEYLLKKLNVDLKNHNNFKNYNLAFNDDQTKKQLDLEQKKVLQENNLQSSQQVNAQNEESKLSTINQQNANKQKYITIGKDEKKLNSENNLNFKNDDINLNVQNNTNNKSQNYFNKNLYSNSESKYLDNNSIRSSWSLQNNLNLSLNNEVKINDTSENKDNFNFLKKENENLNKNNEKKENTKNIKEILKNQNIFSSMNTIEVKDFINKNIEPNSFPVINNNDYTLSNTIDDFQKFVNNATLKNKNDELKNNFFNKDHETTQLIENIQLNLKKIKKDFLIPNDFDIFENWIKKSKDVKKMARLAKKENKKMIKKNKNIG